MIQSDNVHKSFGDKSVLRGASFHSPPGQVAALSGPNGAGKTTMLRMCAGLITPDVGTVRIHGVDVVANRQKAQKHLSFLPQDVRFHRSMTPRHVLRFYARLRQQPTDAIETLLEEVSLIDTADRPCEALSGGMRQRLGLALTWLTGASVLLLDEPGLSLDPDWRAYLKDRLRKHTSQGGTVLMATHLLEVWEDLIDVEFRCANRTIVRAKGSSFAEVATSPCLHHQR